MGRKTKQIPTNKSSSGLRDQDDKLIIDLIEQRKIQQEALTKIMDSMDAVIAQLNHSTTRLLNKSSTKRLKQKLPNP